MLGEAPVDEPVRCVVLAALVDRASLDHPRGRDERGVQDRHGEDEHREHERGDRGLRDLPARREPERAEGEPEHLAAGIAHEDQRGLPRPEVEDEEAEARAHERQGEHEQETLLVDGERVDREERGADQGEGPGETVHVVEQVEGVRHPDEPEGAERRGEEVVRDDLDGQPAGERDRGGAELGRELEPCGQRVDVVDETGDEEDRGPAEDAEELLVGVDAADRDRRADPGGEPEVEADAPEGRGRCSLQRSPLGCATSRFPNGERNSAQITRAQTGRATNAAAALTGDTVTKRCKAVVWRYS